MNAISFQFDNFSVRTVEEAGETWFVAADVCEALTVNESGLYVLIFKSRRVEAKRFRKWVTKEVLPAIRKTGNYGLVASNPYQLTESEAEQVAALGNLTAAYSLV